MKKVLTILTTVLLSLVLVGGLMAIAFASNSGTKYAEVREGYMYFKLSDIPDIFENYLGYTPQMNFDEKKSEATVSLKEGYTVSVPMKQFAPDFWGLEVPADKLEGIFSQWQVYAYKCFDYQTERQFYRENGVKGIYFGWETTQEIFEELTGSKYGLNLTHRRTDYIISARYSVDGTIQNELKVRGDDYEFANNGDLLVSARFLSQLIYDWEMANGDYEPIHLGSII